jgi:hypothetical protein
MLKENDDDGDDPEQNGAASSGAAYGQRIYGGEKDELLECSRQ